MKNAIRFIFLSMIAFTFQQCGPSLHVYNTTNAPCLKEKKEGNLNLYPGADHFELQAAYSPFQNFGLMINSYAAQPRNNSSAGTNFGELGLGRYHTVGKQDRSFKWFYDVFAGFGLGQRRYDGVTSDLDFAGNNYYYSISSSYQKYFVQGSIFFIKGRHRLALGLQGALFHFQNMDFIYGYQNTILYEFHSTDLQLLDLNGSISYKYNFKGNFSFIIQVAKNTSSPNHIPFGTNDIFVLNQRFIEFNCGLQFSFCKKKS